MLHTAKQMSVGIGTVGTVLFEGLAIQVKVVDMRQRWGSTDALVRPLAGHGEKWIESRRVQISDSVSLQVQA